jgi:curved DNA-binding protein CbpA
MLGVAPTASAKEIKSAYFRKAKLLHPDMNPGDTQAKYKFHKISDAYEVLSDEAKRANYDSELMRRSSQSKYSQSTYSSDSTSTTSQSNQSTNQSTNQWSNQSTRTQYDEYNTQPPNDPFQNQSIFQDFDIITEAMKSFVSDLKVPFVWCVFSMVVTINFDVVFVVRTSAWRRFMHCDAAILQTFFAFCAIMH